jgi:hypothetical protein
VPERVKRGAGLHMARHRGAHGVAGHVEQVLGLDVVAVPGLRAPPKFVDCEVLRDEAATDVAPAEVGVATEAVERAPGVGAIPFR